MAPSVWQPEPLLMENLLPGPMGLYAACHGLDATSDRGTRSPAPLRTPCGHPYHKRIIWTGRALSGRSASYSIHLGLLDGAPRRQLHTLEKIRYDEWT